MFQTNFNRLAPTRIEPGFDPGFIPQFLNPFDERHAIEQLDTAYSHGGGWQPFKGFTLNPSNNNIWPFALHYPGDPDQQPRAMWELNGEAVVMFDHAWVAVFKSDNEWEVCHMD